MKKLLCIFLCVNAIISANAQSSKDSVVATVNRFFEGMKNADTFVLKSTLASNAILQTIRDEREKTSVEDEKVAEFIGFVSQLKVGDADEQIKIGTVNVDGSLATVWTPYKFFYKGKFSHCGVNSFQLVRIDQQWKIQYIIDTRRKEGCD
jgi:hypothetical protein